MSNIDNMNNDIFKLIRKYRLNFFWYDDSKHLKKQKKYIEQFKKFYNTQCINIEMQNKNGLSLLNYSSLCEVSELVDFLLKKGANIESKDYKGNTPIMNCMKGVELFRPGDSNDDHTKCLEILLKNKANINTQNNKGNTCVHIFYSKVNDDTLEYTPLYNILNIYGANMKIKNKKGEIPEKQKKSYMSTDEIIRYSEWYCERTIWWV